MVKKCLLLLCLLLWARHAAGQAWSGILKPTSGAGACTLIPAGVPAQCAIDWSQTGIPGGIPSGSWTQSGSTITATGSDQSSQIQTALNACGTNHYVLLAAGTFTINTSVTVPSNCELRGSGANNTILSVHGSSNAPVNVGSSAATTGVVSFVTNAITAGATAGSTSLTLNSTTGVAIGGYLVVTEVDNSSLVNETGSEGFCNFCSGAGGWPATAGTMQNRGQIVEVTNIVGSVVTISPGLYTAYTNSPNAVPFTATAKNAGIRDFQIFANNTGYTNDFQIVGCAYCWARGIEANYTDGNMMEMSWTYRSEVRDCYFSNAFRHGAGVDSDVFINFKSSANQIVNNIVERGHNSIMLNWGAAGNVVAYNYTHGAFDMNPTPNLNATFDGIVMHGNHPQFNLMEGNVSPRYNPDNIWGGSSHNTTFRNWWEGTTVICTPSNTRGTIGCASPALPFQIAYANGINQFSWYDNFVGNVDGSDNQNNVKPYGTGTPTVIPILDWPTTTTFDFNPTNLMFGYDAHDDDGTTGFCAANGLTVPCHSTTPNLTALVYNEYTFKNNTTNCIVGGTTSSTCTATLPSSFFLSAKPLWWPNAVNYPAIGPDVTGGTGPGGHASLTTSNPAQYCYTQIMGGSEGGVNSPLSFNANTCYPSTTSITTATPIVSPNGSQIGNNANSVQPPVMAFGKQGINTSSMAITGSINNCSTPNIALCNGTGSLQLGATVFAVSGTNMNDFVVSPGGCVANLLLGSGGNCKFTVTFTPTAAVGTNETATLTIAYAAGVTSSTMSLTGTSATVTILASPTTPFALAAGINYQLTQNLVCTTSCFTVATGSGSFTDLNLNGFTITWCSGTSTNQEGGVITRGNNWNLTVHNGTITQGGGSCTGVIAGGWGSGAVIGTGSNGMAGTSLFNLNLTWSASQGRGEADNYAGSITGFATVIHDVTYTDNDPGNCNAVGCRSQNQFFSFTVVQAAQRTAASPVDQFYNNTAISGGPQGAFNTNSTGANCSNNLINLGNSGANATVANGYVCQDWGDKWTVKNNLLFGTGTNGGIISGRGIQLANVSGQQVTNSTIQNNNGIVNILNNDAEYNCNSVEFGATYGIQIKVFGSGVMANNTIQNNNLVTQAGACGAYGFSTTNDVSAPATGSVGNVLKNNKWTCQAVAGFTYSSVTNCAGMRIDYAVGNATPMFSSNSDTVTGDSSDLYVYFDGSDAVNFNQDTFVKPSTAVTGWVWIDFTHGLCCASGSFKPGPWTFIDPVFTGGATESNTNLATWATNNSTSAFSYTIKFTQKVLVKAANNGKSITGASCVYTDALSNTYSATSDLTGTCTVVVNENKYAAASGTLTTTHYNNYQLVVSAATCTTSTQTGLNITTTNTTTVNLAGCGGNVDTAFPPTLFGINQTLFCTYSGTTCTPATAFHENTGLVYGWQRSWDTSCVWGLIEVTAGVYNFDTQCHAFIQSAVNHNSGVTFVMGRTPASRITGTCSGGYSGTNTCAQLASDIDGANTITPAFINAWASYMSTTWPNVKWRIEGRNEADLANECAENSTIGGHCSMVHLVKEQQTIYNTVKALSTANTVLCPATSTFNHFGVHLYGGTDSLSAPFTGSGFAAAGGLAYCDIMNVHPYFFAAGATCNPVTTGSFSACTPEEAVNGSFTCAATSTTMSGGLGQIACLLAANNLSAMPVESSETDWGRSPPNILFANGGLSDTQRRQYIGRYIMYAINADQQNITWYTWECPSGTLATCFGTLSGSGVSGAALTALGIMQDWLIGSVITSGTPCTIVSGTTYECALTIHTASGKSGNAEIVFDNSGATPTISAFGATRAYRLDNTSQPIVANQITLDGEPTLLFPLAPWTPGPNCRDYQNGSSQNGRSYSNGATTANGRKCP